MERGERKSRGKIGGRRGGARGKKLGARNATRAETLDGIQTVLEMVFFFVCQRGILDAIALSVLSFGILFRLEGAWWRGKKPKPTRFCEIVPARREETHGLTSYIRQNGEAETRKKELRSPFIRSGLLSSLLSSLFFGRHDKLLLFLVRHLFIPGKTFDLASRTSK